MSLSCKYYQGAEGQASLFWPSIQVPEKMRVNRKQLEVYHTFLNVLSLVKLLNPFIEHSVCIVIVRYLFIILNSFRLVFLSVRIFVLATHINLLFKHNFMRAIIT